MYRRNRLKRTRRAETPADGYVIWQHKTTDIPLLYQWQSIRCPLCVGPPLEHTYRCDIVWAPVHWHLLCHKLHVGIPLYIILQTRTTIAFGYNGLVNTVVCWFSSWLSSEISPTIICSRMIDVYSLDITKIKAFSRSVSSSIL